VTEEIGDGGTVFEVFYHSMTGNTKKLAEAIGAELNVAAESVSTNTKLADDSVLFLGTGLYGPYQSRGLRQFVDRTDFAGRKVALFGTSGEGKGREVGALEQAVSTKGADVIGRFHCKGEFLFFINRNRPTSEDLENARNFARQVADG
jgi:flavodoxin I